VGAITQEPSLVRYSLLIYSRNPSFLLEFCIKSHGYLIRQTSFDFKYPRDLCNYYSALCNFSLTMMYSLMRVVTHT